MNKLSNKEGGDKLMKNKNLMIGALVVLIVGAGGFFAGMQYQNSKEPSYRDERTGFGRDQFSQGGNHQPNRDGFRGRFSRQGQPVAGKVIAKDSESIIVELQDGGSKIVFISDTTSVRKTDEGNLNDLTEGTEVLVFGTENDDGSVTADNIQLNPSFELDHLTEDEREGE